MHVYKISDYIDVRNAKCIAHRQYSMRGRYDRRYPGHEYVVWSDGRLANINIQQNPDFNTPATFITLYDRDGTVMLDKEFIPYDMWGHNKMDADFNAYAAQNIEHNGFVIMRCFVAMGNATHMRHIDGVYVFDDNAPARNAVARMIVNTEDPAASRIGYRIEHRMQIYIPNRTEVQILEILARHAWSRVINTMTLQHKKGDLQYAGK